MYFPERKPMRLHKYDYSQNGTYFVTFCTEYRQPLLSRIVGNAASVNSLDFPENNGGASVGDDAYGVPCVSPGDPNKFCGVPHNLNNAQCDYPDDLHNVKCVPCNSLSNLKIELTATGQTVNQYILNMNTVYPNVRIDKYIIMPNHVHMIIMISVMPVNNNGTPWVASPTVSIPKLINSFKTLTTKKIGKPIWQRSYHDHIIRDKDEHRFIWQYIEENPINWRQDCYFE